MYLFLNLIVLGFAIRISIALARGVQQEASQDSMAGDVRTLPVCLEMFGVRAVCAGVGRVARVWWRRGAVFVSRSRILEILVLRSPQFAAAVGWGEGRSGDAGDEGGAERQ